MISELMYESHKRANYRTFTAKEYQEKENKNSAEKFRKIASRNMYKQDNLPKEGD